MICGIQRTQPATVSSGAVLDAQHFIANTHTLVLAVLASEQGRSNLYSLLSANSREVDFWSLNFQDRCVCVGEVLRVGSFILVEVSEASDNAK